MPHSTLCFKFIWKCDVSPPGERLNLSRGSAPAATTIEELETSCHAPALLVLLMEMATKSHTALDGDNPRMGTMCRTKRLVHRDQEPDYPREHFSRGGGG